MALITTLARRERGSLTYPNAVSGSQQSVKAIEEAQMKYKPKSVAALQIALGGLPDKMRVQADRDIRVSAKTVGELRKVKAWPENLAVSVPQERLPGSVVMVSKASVATRFAAKS